ncbi:Uncharacterised protein [Mycobacterium tuberculosis]|nr:Uncharacterised protein [Mycobacterium tuberculosis]
MTRRNLDPALILAALDGHQIRQRIGGQQHLQDAALGLQHLSQRDGDTNGCDEIH